MERDTLVLILATLVVLGFLATGVLRRYLQARQLLELRRMLHQERGVAPPDAEDGRSPSSAAIDQGLLELLRPAEPQVEGDRRRIRLAALGVGLFLLFTGLGICIGFGLGADERLVESWSIGLVPGMAGIGLLVFYRLAAGE